MKFHKVRDAFTIHVLTLLLFFLGGTLIVQAAGWKALFGVLVIQWANNLERTTKRTYG